MPSLTWREDSVEPAMRVNGEYVQNGWRRPGYKQSMTAQPAGNIGQNILRGDLAAAAADEQLGFPSGRVSMIRFPDLPGRPKIITAVSNPFSHGAWAYRTRFVDRANNHLVNPGA